MTFLELCQFTHRYTAAGNDPPGTAPLDVTNQQGAMFSLVKSVQDAYLGVLNEQTSWTFMQASGTYNVPGNTNLITRAQLQTAIADYGYMITMIGDGSRYILVTSSLTTASPPTPIIFVPYQQWRGWKDRPPINSGQPAYFTIKPDESIQFDVKTNVPMSLTFDYRKKAPKLVNNTDTPIFNEEYHAAVAWSAVRYWALTQESPTKFQTATQEYEKIMNEMRSRYLPEIVFSVGEFTGTRSALTS